MKLLQVVAIFVLLGLPTAEAQTLTGSMLHIEVENVVFYIQDCPISDLGKNPNPLTTRGVPQLLSGRGIGDIVSVNGTPVKGTQYQSLVSGVSPTPSLTPGRAIGDGARVANFHLNFDFLNPDGTQIGTIEISGMEGGLPPPGAPQEITAGAWTVIGGTGAFFGARGYYQHTASPLVRQTSACEDPAYRRVNGGGTRHAVLYLVPLVQPQVLTNGNAPAVVHASDGSVVSAAAPAKFGEVLTLYASGLGPTRPGVDPGEPFPADPMQVVNSPVQILVNGNPADVLEARGYPGGVDRYQVNFRVPDATTPGQAALQLRSAWITGPKVNIPVQ